MKSKMSRLDHCELTDHYEAAIMHHRYLHVRWQDQQGEHEQRLLPTDLRCDHGRDYLLAEGAQGRQLRICLDEIADVR
ncbi:MAG: hypothetical protein V7739_00250 [Motiliproteus sp.]